MVDTTELTPPTRQRYKTLRIWITNTVEDQFWQTNSLNVDSFDFSSNLEASYRVKIEGRLLDDDDDEAEADKDDAPNPADDADKMDTDSPAKSKQPKAIAAKPGQRHRFSHFFKALTVDFDRSKLAAAAGGRPAGMDASVEWKKPDRAPAAPAAALPAMADFDEFTFKRNGEENTNITINLFRHEDPERFELSPELADVVDLREATRQEAVVGMWEYIKLMNLQEDEEKRNFRCDEILRKVLPPSSPPHNDNPNNPPPPRRSSTKTQATSPSSTTTSHATSSPSPRSPSPTPSASTKPSTPPRPPRPRPSTTCASPSTTPSARASRPSSTARSTPRRCAASPTSTRTWGSSCRLS